MTFKADFDLKAGSHELPGDGCCAMEAAVLVAGFDWIQIKNFCDLPECFCPTLGSFVIRLNDEMPDDGRQLLKPLIVRLVSTAGLERDRQQRCDHLVMKAALPAAVMALKNVDAPNWAKALENCKDAQEIHSFMFQLLPNLTDYVKVFTDSGHMGCPFHEALHCVQTLNMLTGISHGANNKARKVAQCIGYAWYCHKYSNSAFDWTPFISALEGAIAIGPQAPKIEINDIKSRVKILEGFDL